MAIVVELLSKNNKTLKHFVVNRSEVSIGRAFDNDIRIDDPYVCPHHIAVSKSEDTDALTVTDRHSVNGVKKNKKSVVKAQVNQSDIITIGRTRLRVFDDQQAVEATLELSQLEEKIEWLGSRAICFSLLLVVVAMVSAQFFFKTFTELNYAVLTKLVLTVIATSSIWPLAFAFLSKLFKKDTHIVSQFSILWLFLISSSVLDFIAIVLEFNSEHLNFVFWLTLAIKGALFCALLWFSLFLAFHQSQTTRNRLTLAGLALVAAPILLPMLVASDNFRSTPKYKATLLAPVFQIGSPDTTEEFIQGSESIFTELDKKVAEEQDE